jgi:hypothetical protein
VFRSQAGAGSAVDDPGGGVGDPGGGNTDDLGTFGDLAFPLRLPQITPRRLSPLFDDRDFFVVPFGQVDCGCGGKFRRGLRYWVILLFVCHPAACGGWALEWGVVCAATTAAVGAIES